MDQAHIDSLNEQRLAPLMPELQDKVRALIAGCKDKMDPLLITQGLRTFAEQAALYAQGRMSLDEVNAMRKAVNQAPLTPIQNIEVTHAAAGTSFHNYGCAIDVCPEATQPNDPNDEQPDWNEDHPDWRTIVEVATSLGLEHGDRGYHDNPHFQLIANPSTPIADRISPKDLLKLYKPNDLTDCWNEIRSRL